MPCRNTTAPTRTLLCEQVSAVYQLEFMGDYQTGAYDTDAAENVAYDKITKRAFLASAESGTVQVIDLSNPTQLSQSSTLHVGALMVSECTDVDCDYEDQDFGGGSAPCGLSLSPDPLLANSLCLRR